MIKTVSLETAKLLKEAGFKNLKLYFHYNNPVTGIGKPEWELERHCFDYNYIYSLPAPTTDELLEELPQYIGEDTHNHAHLHITNGTRHLAKWTVGYANYEKSCSEIIDHESLPEALAQMWLWLKKEGLIGGVE